MPAVRFHYSCSTSQTTDGGVQVTFGDELGSRGRAADAEGNGKTRRFGLKLRNF